MNKLRLTSLMIFFITVTQLHAEKMSKEQLWPIFVEAGKIYKVDPYMLLAIGEQESALDPNAVNDRNRNKSVDIGIMQVNSWWYPKLRKYTPNPKAALYDPNYNIKVGAWILGQCMHSFGESWKAIDCYNKGAGNARHGSSYNNKVWKKYKRYLQSSKNNNTKQKS